MTDSTETTEQHVHEAEEEYSYPPYHPHHFEEVCSCGMWRYRVKGGPWTQWELPSED